MKELCTLHQVVGSSGLPSVQGSEVRLPSGEAIPYVTSVKTEAVLGQQYWETTITLRTRFGAPIHCDTDIAAWADG